jgi:hypothetical protein
MATATHRKSASFAAKTVAHSLRVHTRWSGSDAVALDETALSAALELLRPVPVSRRINTDEMSRCTDCIAAVKVRGSGRWRDSQSRSMRSNVDTSSENRRLNTVSASY